EALQLVELVVEDLVDGPKVPRRLSVRDFEQVTLERLDQLLRLTGPLTDFSLDLVRKVEHLPEQGLLLDELSVLARIAGRRHSGRKLMDVCFAAGPFQLSPLLQLGADRERVNRLVLGVERQDRAEDRPM